MILPCEARKPSPGAGNNCISDIQRCSSASLGVDQASSMDQRNAILWSSPENFLKRIRGWNGHQPPPGGLESNAPVPWKLHRIAGSTIRD